MLQDLVFLYIVGMTDENATLLRYPLVVFKGCKILINWQDDAEMYCEIHVQNQCTKLNNKSLIKRC